MNPRFPRFFGSAAVFTAIGVMWPGPLPARAQEAPPDLLAGPVVIDTPAPVMLITRDFAGDIVALEERPEAAAIKLMTLSYEQRAAADAILLERVKAINAALSDHMPLFLELQQARLANDRAAVVKLIPDFRRELGDLIEPSLADQLAAAIGESEGIELKRLVDEYLVAVAPDVPERRMDRRQRAPKTDDSMAQETATEPVVLTRRVRARMELNLLVREMARSLAATVAERTERMDAMLAAVDASPEQAAKIKSLARTQARGLGTLSPTEREAYMQKLLAELTPEQRRSFMRAVRE